MNGVREPSPGDAGGAVPLADRLRPQTLAEVVGQAHILGQSGPIGRMIETGEYGSFVLWGPPGVGKTTIARLVAAASGRAFESLSAVFSGVADLRKAFERARQRTAEGSGSVLFVDEIHRFNRAQQDAFLPPVEDGTVLLIGATTENPSFELNSALLSRLQVLVLHRLDADALETLLTRAESTVGRKLPVTDAGRQLLCEMADGDGRAVLNLAEPLFAEPADEPLGPAELTERLARRAAIYDKSRDEHYNLISALHKSVRGSDVDAALYWLYRMLNAGEQPLYIARRVVRMAVEDIGLADPQALQHALAAKDAYDFLGSPEGELAIAQAVIYCATAPKSNAAYMAAKEAEHTAKEAGSHMPPKHILNAPTGLMKAEGYGSGYAYDHDQPDAFSGQDYFPEELGRRTFYAPPARGFEREIEKRLQYWQRLRDKRQGESHS